MGMTKYMVGAAITQAITHDDIQVRNMPSAGPRARHVATPETRSVMKNEVPSANAARW
jgi:hypothetical protein